MSQHQVAGLQVDAGDFRLVYLPFHLHGVDAEVYRSLIEAGVHFLYQAEAPVFAFEIVDHALVEGTLVLDADEQVRVRLHLEGEVERGELQVRSPLRSELEQVLPLRPVDRAEGTQIYEAVFRPPSAGRFELKPQFYNQVALLSQGHLPILAMPPRPSRRLASAPAPSPTRRSLGGGPWRRGRALLAVSARCECAQASCSHRGGPVPGVWAY